MLLLEWTSWLLSDVIPGTATMMDSIKVQLIGFSHWTNDTRRNETSGHLPSVLSPGLEVNWATSTILTANCWPVSLLMHRLTTLKGPLENNARHESNALTTRSRERVKRGKLRTNLTTTRWRPVATLVKQLPAVNVNPASAPYRWVKASAGNSNHIQWQNHWFIHTGAAENYIFDKKTEAS